MKKQLISNAIAHNKFLDSEDLQNKDVLTILRFCHPIDRIDFCRKFDINIERENLTWKY